MKKIITHIAAALVCLLVTQTTVMASSHREAPLISTDPLADNTDLYAFRSPTDSSKIILIANYIPFEHPAGGPNWYTFGENIRYEIHVDNNANTAGSDIIYRFTFSQVNQDSSTFFRIRLGKENWKTSYTLERSIDGGASFLPIITNGIVPPPNIGPRSIENATVGLGAPNYDSLMQRAIKMATTGEKVFAGPIDDPFFVDLGGAFDLGNFRQPGRDGLAKFNCHSLVIEVPISTLQKDNLPVTAATNILDDRFIIGVFASASRPQIYTFDSTGGNGTTSGNWVQVSRLGMPLTNEVVIPIGQKDKFNANTTRNDSQFHKFMKNPELALYMDDSQFGTAVPGLAQLRIQTNSLGQFDFRNGKKGLFPLKGSTAVQGTALDDAAFGNFLLPDSMSPRAVDILPIFTTGVPNLRPYQLATGKPRGNPLAEGKPFINNFLPTFGDMLRLNMAVPATPRNSPDFSSLGLVKAAVLGLTDNRFNQTMAIQNIPNMDGFPNGRRLEDDVTTIELQAVGGVVLAAIGLWYDDYNVNDPNASPVTPQLGSTLAFNAGVTQNDTTLKAAFPFVQGPWRGFVGASYQGDNPLPVNFVNFTAEKQQEDVMLRWQVNNEINNEYYHVEQSLDGRSYKQIGRVNAMAGTTNQYSHLHTNPARDKVNYYRLKQVDKDGRFTYSAIRAIRFSGKNLLTISPNPATDVIRVFASQNNMNIHILDENGKLLMSRKLMNGSVEVNLTGLPRGAYMIVAESNGVRIETRKIIKQ
ncbi:DUF4331 family protein [Aridibaculum aurantiacum]|uniref:DUF4331 family protein n=1 Tax=Aridibaculum aurantiacum TaxID=2810307 RepID=UPI001A966BCF|nr:DUF4331 family protein [Aridibaculum aurantiacum]